MLYRFFDSSGQLLYVGITDDPKIRWGSHARHSTDGWWARVCVVHTEWLPSRSAAEAAEIAAIRLEGPLHNGSHNQRPRVGRQRPAMYLHPMARERFGDRPFTYRDLAEQLGIPYGTVVLYGRRLIQKGTFRKVGDVKAGSGNRRGLFVAVDSASPSDTSPVKAPLLAGGDRLEVR